MIPSTVPGPRPVLRHRHPRPMPLRHVIMLALAAEILVMGWCWADHYRPPGIVVDATFTEGHEIT